MILQFIHDQNKLTVNGKTYKATNPVRNQLNGERDAGQTVKTYPIDGPQKWYDPRKFPTGLWEITGVEWTDHDEYAPVKIKTDATRRVMTNDGTIQTDSCYYLHYCGISQTTLGCIRIDSKADAIEIGKFVESRKDKMYIEVIASTGCVRSRQC